MASITVRRFSSGCWASASERLDQCLKECQDSKPQYLLMRSDAYSTGGQLAPELVRYFKIPRYLLSDVYRRSNGYFATKNSLDEQGNLESYYMWFRVLVKSVRSQGYKWHEMTFCLRWNLGCYSMLCIGVDASFERFLQNALDSIWSTLPALDPCSLLAPLLEAVIAMYDESIWLMRDVVRNAEKDRIRPTYRHDDFVLLHEAARHAIHSHETLSVTVDTMAALHTQVLYLSKMTTAVSGPSIKASERVMRHMESQMRMLKNLLLRAQSNKERQQSEIALAYNMIAQRDSKVTTVIGEAARRDSQAMRTIAVVTMAFLPPTFLSAIFSMSFFNYTPSQDGQSAKWSVSGMFWIYWVLAIPLTCLTLGTWFWQQKRHRDSR